MRGRVLALQSMVFLGSTPIGGPLLGAICDRYGPRAGIFLGGLSALAAAALGHVVFKRVWRPVDDDAEVDLTPVEALECVEETIDPAFEEPAAAQHA